MRTPAGPALAALIRSMSIGASCLHGPHHSAWQSRTIGTVLCCTICAKFCSVTSNIAASACAAAELNVRVAKFWDGHVIVMDVGIGVARSMGEVRLSGRGTGTICGTARAIGIDVVVKLAWAGDSAAIAGNDDRVAHARRRDTDHMLAR